MKSPQSLDNSLDDVKYEQYINNLQGRLPDLADPNDIDCQRWPWELLQNAKDTVVKRKNPEERYVDVAIKYYTDSEGKKKLYFEHNGDQFTNKAITGLIWKFSAEKRNEQTTEDGLTRDKQSTGRFGTGFMTTHALSLTVDVSGSLFHDDSDVMRNVSVDFTLHREGPDDEAYKAGVNRTEQELKENMGKKPILAGSILPTRFTYHLNKEASDKAAMMGINNVRANAAQTMLFCPSVRSIEVIDDVNHTTFKITRKNNDESKNSVKETVFVEESSNKAESVIRRFISIEIEEYSKEISSHWKATNRNLRLHIAVEVDKDNNILPIPSSSPSVYCSLPLIGFESMALPFYINSNDFEPTTERTSLFLKKKRFEYHSNENTGEDELFYLKNGINWAILERAIPLYEKVVDYLIENNYNQRYNLIYGLGNILNGAWETETKNCLASRLIVPLRNMLVKKELVETAKGYRSIDSDVKFVECSKDCDLHDLYEICKTIYGTNLALEGINESWVALKWGRFNFAPEFDEKKTDSENPPFPTVKYDKVAKYIEDAGCIDNLNVIIDSDSDSGNFSGEEQQKACLKEQKLNWLNKFYKWLKESKITNLSDKKIVPNRIGDFCSTEQGCDLKDASEIPTSIFDFMKRIGINWDKNLLMEGVQHITLAKETKDNIVSAIKNRTKEIRDYAYDNESAKLTKLMPLLLALPTNEDGRSEEFYRKRVQIVSILNTMYRSKISCVESITLELKSETWEDTDKWLMNVVAKEIANRKKLDVIVEGDTEEVILSKYCTATWLSGTLDFMFQKSYLHQEDITSKEDKTDILSIIPNRYGDFCPINKLYTQGHIPDELLSDELNKTGYDIKTELLYKNFVLNEKVTITDKPLTSLATTYNNFFKSTEKESDKLAVAKFLIHLIPECGDLYQEIRILYNEFIRAKDEDKTTKIITTSDLNIWEGAKHFILSYLSNNVSNWGSIESIGQNISFSEEQYKLDKTNEYYKEKGIAWLNKLVTQIGKHKVDIPDEIKLTPDWYGTLHCNSDMVYDGSQLQNYQNTSRLIDIIDGQLWSYFNQKEAGDENLTLSIVHPNFINVSNFQNNTNEKIFDLVDRIIEYCSKNYSSGWRNLLKDAIKTLLSFFEDNEQYTSWPGNYGKGDDRLSNLFKKTYPKRKELSYDFIFDAETKARFSQMNDNYSSDEMEILIENKEFVKKILQNKDIVTIQKIIEEFPDTDFKSILNILRKEQGDYNTDSFQQSISDERKREIGDKGECYVYELLCKQFGSSNIKWSNQATIDNYDRIVSFNGREHRLATTIHDFDFIVYQNGKTIYIEVKTTVGNIENSKDFPLIFETKEWAWIDKIQDEETLHYIVRVFDIEGTPKAYFLKQTLSINY